MTLLAGYQVSDRYPLGCWFEVVTTTAPAVFIKSSKIIDKIIDNKGKQRILVELRPNWNFQLPLTIASAVVFLLLN